MAGRAATVAAATTAAAPTTPTHHQNPPGHIGLRREAGDEQAGGRRQSRPSPKALERSLLTVQGARHLSESDSGFAVHDVETYRGGGTPSLARLADAYDPAAPGTKIDWTRLRSFVAWTSRHPDQLEAAIELPPARTGTVLDGILAAMAERLADEAGVPVPRWASAVPPEATPWRPPGTPKMQAAAARATPPQFKRRKITLPAAALWRKGP